MTRPTPRRKLTDALATRFMPSELLAAQLRKPSGRFGRWVMTRALNRGNADLISATVDALQLREDDVFMDIGFGGGRGLELAASRTRTASWGVDFSADIVAEAARRFGQRIARGELQLLAADAADLPLRDALVSTICTTNTIYFWPDPARVLRECHRVLRAHGRLAIGFSGSDKMRKFDRITRHGFSYYDPPQVEALLHDAGFVDVRTITLHGEVSEGDYVTLGSKA